jgi:hypothetical protein
MDNILDTILNKFHSYRTTHPNIAQCWLAYLALKKRHYSEMDLAQGEHVLACIANGIPDLKKNDMVRLVMYKHSII